MDIQKVKEIIDNFKDSNNKDIISALDFLSKEHESVKQTILKLTYYFDEVEKSYNKLLEEYKNRTKNNG
jgi:hypothetical protein